MNSLVILLIAAVALLCGYVFYGGWLAKTWGIDPKKKTPAVEINDGEDYVPASKFTVFAHQFSSIAGAGPVQGPIMAAMFGWVPVLLWLLIGGIFFGAVQDFGALYASVKNKGESITMVINCSRAEAIRNRHKKQHPVLRADGEAKKPRDRQHNGNDNDPLCLHFPHETRT